MDPVERLLRHVTITDTGCWDRPRTLDRDGYSRIGIGKGRVFYAHRVAFEVFTGPIPPGTEIDHVCRNRRCVNPDHLEAVSHRVNCIRSVNARAGA